MYTNRIVTLTTNVIYNKLIYHVSIVGPRAELHEAGLLVEGEILDINFAKGLVNRRRLPHHFARVMKDRFSHDGHFVVAIGAVDIRRNVKLTQKKIT